MSLFERWANPLRASVACRPGLVSVVLPVYNGADYLREAILSVQQQSYRDWELLIVNDGSTDDSPLIARELAARDRRIRVIDQPNRKLPRALSAGFRLAQGEYYTWTSADNRMSPQFLDVLVRSLVKHSSWDMVYTDMRIIGADGSALRGTDFIKPYQDSIDSSVIHYPDDTEVMEHEVRNVIGGAFLYRAICGRVLGDYDPAFFTAEDYEYWLRMRTCFRIAHLRQERPLYDYRFHPNTLSASAHAHGTYALSVALLEQHRRRKATYPEPLQLVLPECQSKPGSFRQRLAEAAVRAGCRLVTTAASGPARNSRDCLGFRLQSYDGRIILEGHASRNLVVRDPVRRRFRCAIAIEEMASGPSCCFGAANWDPVIQSMLARARSELGRNA